MEHSGHRPKWLQDWGFGEQKQDLKERGRGQRERLAVAALSQETGGKCDFDLAV